MRNFVMIFLIGLGGVAVLVSLGVWQVQRLQWKAAVLAEIEARLDDAAVPLPAAPDPEADKYAPVTVEGRIAGAPIRVLASRKAVGAGHRLIVPFETAAGRRVMVDLGFLPQGREMPEMPGAPVALEGNLHWPDEVDGFTPEPDVAEGLWFARDVPAMAAALEAEPVLIVRRSGGDLPGVTPWPVDTAGIPNDHLEYAVTWFSLAAIWLAMSGFLVYRMAKPGKGAA
ncbi:MAG: SURF1 family protein [Pseudooceanicola sp.]